MFSVPIFDSTPGGEIGSWFSGCYKNPEDACFLVDHQPGLDPFDKVHTPFTKTVRPRFRTKPMKRLKVEIFAVLKDIGLICFFVRKARTGGQIVLARI